MVVVLLKIRRHQLKSLQEALDNTYCLRLRDYFRKAFPVETAKWDDDVLLQTVTESVSKARTLGAKTARSIQCYVCIAILIDKNFDEEANTRAFLECKHLDPDYKIELLTDILISNLDNVQEG